MRENDIIKKKFLTLKFFRIMPLKQTFPEENMKITRRNS